MKRYAAHYLFFSSGELYKNHWIELDKHSIIKAVLPLTEEISDTGFYNGIIFPLNTSVLFDTIQMMRDLTTMQSKHPDQSVFELLEKKLEMMGLSHNGHQLRFFDPQSPVSLFHLDGIDLPASKFRTGNGSSNSYIQRL